MSKGKVFVFQTFQVTQHFRFGMMRIEHRMGQERASALAMRRNTAETGGDDFRIQGFYAQTVTFAQQNVE